MPEDKPRIEHRVVAGQHVFTSPDLPELIVAHADYETARADVEPVLATIRAIKQRKAAQTAQKRAIA